MTVDDNAEQPKKCKHCGAEITGASDECYRCIDNPKRQKMLAKLNRQPLTYQACPNEGEVLQTVETDAKGKPTKSYCPVCREETTEPIEKTYNQKLYSYPYFCDDPEKRTGFKPARVAESIKANFLFKTDRKTDILYRYDDVQGIWRADGEVYLRELVAESLGKDNYECHFRNILFHLKSITYQDVEFRARWVATPNCLLDVETGLTKPLTPNEMTMFAIPTVYNPDAKCAKFRAWIDQVCPEDKDSLQEWSGFLLLANYKFHRMGWLLGQTARNGKGTWQRTIQLILGKENCSNIRLEEFDGNHRFSLYQFRHSLFNTSSEPSVKKALSVEILDSLTGKDMIDAEIKGKQARVQFFSVAKQTIIGNQFPRIEKPTDAFWLRLLLINFPNRFVGKDQIQDIEDTWLLDSEEPSGILNWMLEGLHRLLKNRDFSSSRTQEQMVIAFKRASDSTSAFIAEWTQLIPPVITPKIDLFNHYKEYCDYYGLNPVSPAQFNSKIALLPRVKETSKRIDGKKVKVWQGIKVNLPEEPEEEGESEEKQRSGTGGTSGTSFYSQKKIDDVYNIENKKAVPAVPLVPKLLESDIDGYSQLSCYFCNKPIIDDRWTSDDFTEGKPAHQKCYDDCRAQLKEASKP